MTPSEDDAEFSVIYLTISQAGRLGRRSQSLAFVIRYTELSGSDLPDIDVITIAQMMTVNQYYDLGVALGFTIQQLDVIEYRRFCNREQAIYDMLVTWRKRQISGQEAKETFLSLMKSLVSPAEQTEISDDSLEELYKTMCSVSDLLQLAPRLHFGASDIMRAMCKTVTLPPYVVHPVVLHMLREWLRRGGTRGRLLEIVQAFRFNDAAESIAATIKVDPGFVEFFSNSVLDHRGGVVELRELDIRVAIPSGALNRGMRSVVTIRVPREGAARIPLRDGEVLITPVVDCSLTQELLEPATVVLPHCVGPKQCRDGSGMILYTKTGLGTFSRRRLLPNSSEGFHVSKDTVVFPTNHLQLFALSSTNVQGVQFRCVTFQPLFMPCSRKVTLRVYVTHPYRRPIKA
ncbi:uncharacterized protein LOC115925087 [Strongylocentrotus purpuratus]|uniref:ZU5 domain-containing protein n=1 Tax=Strongylocentrotus purpuratus TaxID=7668 RepID=A0A7M7P0P1_STRPU|nr:uncharacterized protein LOC115925087 [Strongylocentrotus purpuratus]